MRTMQKSRAFYQTQAKHPLFVPKVRFSGLLREALGLPDYNQHDPTLLRYLDGLFSVSLENGELDFLMSKVVRVIIQDVGIETTFTVGAHHTFVACHDWRRADLQIAGSLLRFVELCVSWHATTSLVDAGFQVSGDVETALQAARFLSNYRCRKTDSDSIGRWHRIVEGLSRQHKYHIHAE